jgi:hypothetical protein
MFGSKRRIAAEAARQRAWREAHPPPQPGTPEWNEMIRTFAERERARLDGIARSHGFRDYKHEIEHAAAAGPLPPPLIRPPCTKCGGSGMYNYNRVNPHMTGEQSIRPCNACGGRG